MRPARVDVLVRTRRDGATIAGVVRHAARVGRVLVLDAEGDARTLEAARAAGAADARGAEPGRFASNRWALEHLPFEGDWVLLLWGHERVTPELRGDVWRVAEDDGPCAVYRARRVGVFSGRVVRRALDGPRWELRLLRRGRVRFEPVPGRGDGPERAVYEGGAGALAGQVVQARPESITEAIQRRIELAELEARARTAAVAERDPPLIPTPSPVRAFLTTYFGRLGFLDGAAGVHAAAIAAGAAYMTALLMKERTLTAAEQGIAGGVGGGIAGGGAGGVGGGVGGGGDIAPGGPGVRAEGRSVVGAAPSARGS